MNIEEYYAEQATGCLGAGDYRKWAREQGYPYLETVDLTSSAGDWSFVVSENGLEWYLMFQENSFPSPGFARWIDDGVMVEAENGIDAAQAFFEFYNDLAG